MMIWLLFGCLILVVCGQPNQLVSQQAATLFQSTYYPKWQSLYLKESGSGYPMPPSSKVQDLLKTFQGVGGIAVNTDPGITVSEGQGYALFAAGMAKDVDNLKGLTVAWQAMGQGLPDRSPVGGCTENGGNDGCLCKKVPGAYMPAWRFPLSQCAMGCTGSAPDGDEDAVTGIIYLAELTGDEEIRKYPVESIVAFVVDDLGLGDVDKNSRPVPAQGDIPANLQKMFLWRGGSCWGGYDTTSGDPNRDLCINPSYFSPGQYRLFRNYLKKYPTYIPTGYNLTELTDVIESSITWGYNTLNRIACDNGLVTNWWSLPTSGWPWNGKLLCANSGTAAGAYGADACRTPWRIALDAIWYPQESSSVPLFDETGKKIGTFGGPQYANRWSTAYIKLLLASNSSCPSPNCVPFYDAVPMLTKFAPCTDCPSGFQASAWNAWGYLPPITTFAVPITGMGTSVQQSWFDLMVSYIPLVNFPSQYYDEGQEVITTAIMGGKAWLPV
jgi:hypothetical protein